jgi:hypothetical protein
VWIPVLEFFSNDKLGMVIEEKIHLKLKDVAGLHTSHVSRSLAPYFSDILNNDGIVFSEVNGSTVHSYPPWPAPHEEGAVLCNT